MNILGVMHSIRIILVFKIDIRTFISYTVLLSVIEYKFHLFCTLGTTLTIFVERNQIEVQTKMLITQEPVKLKL
jgi:hypothetical protein